MNDNDKTRLQIQEAIVQGQNILHKSSRSPGCSKAEQIMTAVIQYGDAREIARQAEIDGGRAKRAEVAELLAEKYRQVARLVGL